MAFITSLLRPIKLAAYVAVLGFLASGCSLETKIEDLNKIKKPSTSTSNPFGVKVSGGAQTLTGAGVDAEISIGLKERLIEGSAVDMSATISASRPE